MNAANRTTTKLLAQLLRSSDYAEAGPSSKFSGAPDKTPNGAPTAEQVAAAVAKLEAAERANDSGPVVRALAAVVAALG